MRVDTRQSTFAAIDSFFALLVVAAAARASVWSWSGVLQPLSVHVHASDLLFAAAFTVTWQYCFASLRLYDRTATMPSRVSAIAQGVCIMLVPVSVYGFIFHREFTTIRSACYIGISLVIFEISRLLMRDIVFDYLDQRDPQQVVIVGSGRRAGKAWRELRTRYPKSVTMLGFVDNRSARDMMPDIQARFLGSVDQLNSLVLSRTIDMIVVAMPLHSCYPVMQQAVTIAESVGLRVIYLQDIYDTNQGKIAADEPLFQELFPQHDAFLIGQGLKRAFDILVSGIGLLILSPLLLIIATAVKATSRGPAVFVQKRFGHRRRVFNIYKFRSMVLDAEQQLASLESLNEVNGPIFKIKTDPRITRIGKVLRMTSLDEVPQLWNVFKGDMSLVGPRPMSLRDVALFSEAALLRRFSVMPGITGLWQVNGRSSVGFDEWVLWDNCYIEQWSLSLDAKILLKTVRVVLKRSGAV